MTEMTERARALCQDGRVRTVRYSKNPDTYFFCPACTYMRVAGRTKKVSGFLTKVDSDIPESMAPKSGLEFNAYNRFLGVMPDNLKSTKAMMNPLNLAAKYRWVWDSLWYHEKWGI